MCWLSFPTLNKKGVEEEINSYEKELGIITQSITSVNSKLNDLQKSSNIKNEEKEDRIAFSETAPLEGSAPHTSSKDPIIFSVKKNKWKLIYTKPINKFELYDVSSDNNEEDNLFGKGLKEEKEMIDLLRQYVSI